jgi:hypothetical protein
MIVGRIVAGVGNGLNTSTIRRFPHRGHWCIANISSCVALGAHEGRCPRQGCKSDQSEHKVKRLIMCSCPSSWPSTSSAS